MIDMCRRYKAVQPCVNRGCARVEVKDAMPQRLDHGVFLIKAFILTAQLEQLVHIQGRKPVQLHRADIPARPLDPQHLHIRPRQRVARCDLGRGVAPAKIGDPQIRPKQVGPIQQFARLIERGGDGVVPKGREEDVLGHTKNLGTESLIVNHYAAYCSAENLLQRSNAIGC